MNVLLCATDAGGARNLAALDQALSRRGVDVTVVTSAASRHLFGPAEWARDVIVDADLRDAGALLRRTRSSAVVCGTTSFPSIDRALLNEAAGARVRSVAVVDERYGYRDRFCAPDGTWVLPTVVALMDAESKREAVAEGLPEDCCHVTGSPGLARLREVASAFAASPPGRSELLNGLPAWPVVTFLSERYELDYGSREGEVGPLGPFPGYTERTVFAAVARALAALDQPVILVEKLHPAQAGTPIERDPLVQSDRVLHVRLLNADLWTLFASSAAVVGMRSMGLLEARMLGVPAASYQPTVRGPQRCSAVRLGLVPCLSDEESLAAWLLEAGRDTAGRRDAGSLPCARADAADRVLDAALFDVPPLVSRAGFE